MDSGRDDEQVEVGRRLGAAIIRASADLIPGDPRSHQFYMMRKDGVLIEARLVACLPPEA